MVHIEKRDAVTAVISIVRSTKRHRSGAADALAEAFAHRRRRTPRWPYCAGNGVLRRRDLKRFNNGMHAAARPIGISRMALGKPVIAAVSGYAVAGGLELAIWCDLRVAEEDAVFGVFCRRWGVPLIDDGTIRLPRLIGSSRALDMILTGRPVKADEALAMGLANRLVPTEQSRGAAERLAREIAAMPQECMRNDRRSVYDQFALEMDQAIRNEFALGERSLASAELSGGLARFRAGQGRHGSFGH
jgi:enoyl-CoA hydratase